MEQINFVHLRGRVGNVRAIERDGVPTAYRFSLATEYCYNDRGTIIIETTWHDVQFLNKWNDKFDWLEKGSACEVEGRLKNVRYTDKDGVDHTSVIIVAKKVTRVEE